MNQNTRIRKTIYFSLIAIISALYVVLVITIPIAWEIPQVRFADALFSTVFIFGYPGAIGITIGCVIANMVGGLGIIDIAFGSLANLLGGVLGYFLYRKIKHVEGKKKYVYVQLILLMMNLINTFIVGTYLPILLGYPFWLSYLGIFTGSLISMNIIGFILYLAFERAKLELYFNPHQTNNYNTNYE